MSPVVHNPNNFVAHEGLQRHNTSDSFAPWGPKQVEPPTWRAGHTPMQDSMPELLQPLEQRIRAPQSNPVHSSSRYRKSGVFGGDVSAMMSEGSHKHTNQNSRVSAAFGMNDSDRLSYDNDFSAVQEQTVLKFDNSVDRSISPQRTISRGELGDRLTGRRSSAPPIEQGRDILCDWRKSAINNNSPRSAPSSIHGRRASGPPQMHHFSGNDLSLHPADTRGFMHSRSAEELNGDVNIGESGGFETRGIRSVQNFARVEGASDQFAVTNIENGSYQNYIMASSDPNGHRGYKDETSKGANDKVIGPRKLKINSHESMNICHEPPQTPLSPLSPRSQFNSPASHSAMIGASVDHATFGMHASGMTSSDDMYQAARAEQQFVYDGAGRRFFQHGATRYYETGEEKDMYYVDHDKTRMYDNAAYVQQSQTYVSPHQMQYATGQLQRGHISWPNVMGNQQQCLDSVDEHHLAAVNSYSEHKETHLATPTSVEQIERQGPLGVQPHIVRNNALYRHMAPQHQILLRREQYQNYIIYDRTSGARLVVDESSPHLHNQVLPNLPSHHSYLVTPQNVDREELLFSDMKGNICNYSALQDANAMISVNGVPGGAPRKLDQAAHVPTMVSQQNSGALTPGALTMVTAPVGLSVNTTTPAPVGLSVNTDAPVSPANNYEITLNHTGLPPIPLNQLPQKKDGSQWVRPITIDQLHSNIVNLAKSQYGSRLLQDYVMGDNEDITELIFEEIKGVLPDLMVDLFGNYLCQQVLQKICSGQMTTTINSLKDDMINIAYDRQGTRALQRLIEYAHTPQQRIVIIGAFNVPEQVLKLMFDSHGCYVITAMLENMPIDDCDFIFNVAVHHCEKLASDQHGLCVLKKCVSLTSPKQQLPQNISKRCCNEGVEKNARTSQHNRLSAKILDFADTFVNNQFGNYLIQNLLDVATPDCMQLLHTRFKSHYCAYSGQKFSSNVVEKFLRVASDSIKADIIQEIINAPDFFTLLQDSFGNYVIQNALQTASKKQAFELMKIIGPFTGSLAKNNVQRKWERLLENTRNKFDPEYQKNKQEQKRVKSKEVVPTRSYSGLQQQPHPAATNGWYAPAQVHGCRFSDPGSPPLVASSQAKLEHPSVFPGSQQSRLGGMDIPSTLLPQDGGIPQMQSTPALTIRTDDGVIVAGRSKNAKQKQQPSNGQRKKNQRKKRRGGRGGHHRT